MKGIFKLLSVLIVILFISSCCEEYESGDCVKFKGHEWLVSEGNKNSDDCEIEISRTNSKGNYVELEVRVNKVKRVKCQENTID